MTTIYQPAIKHEPWCPFFITHGRQECKCKPAVKAPTLSDVAASPEQTKWRSDYAAQIAVARDVYAVDDDCEIDDEPLLSPAEHDGGRGDGKGGTIKGVWVNAWVWIPLDEDE
jgi:hypothetical protein